MTALLVIPYNLRLFEALNINILRNVIVRIVLSSVISSYDRINISNLIDALEMAEGRRSFSESRP